MEGEKTKLQNSLSQPKVANKLFKKLFYKASFKEHLRTCAQFDKKVHCNSQKFMRILNFSG